jgi:excisionase family DNA binding protein
VTTLDTLWQSQHELEPLLSVEDVMGILRVSESTVYRLMRSRELVCVKLGHRTLFEREEIRRYITSKRDEQRATPIGTEVDHG